MDFTIGSIWSFIRANFFYDLKSSVISIFVILGTFFFIKLLKDNGEKVKKSFNYLSCVIICFGIVMLLY